jgi:hypothetical protein
METYIVNRAAIGSAVGSGLMIGSGSKLSKAGPVGLLIGSSLVGLICFTVMTALGEVGLQVEVRPIRLIEHPRRSPDGDLVARQARIPRLCVSGPFVAH